MSSESSPNNKQSAVAALVRIAVAAVVLFGIYFAYARYQDNSRKIKALEKSAHELTLQDNPRAYAEATAKLEEALKIRSSDPFAIAARAEIAGIQWLEFGQDAAKTVALEGAQAAAGTNANTEHRFSAEGLALIGEGKIGEAETMLIGVIDKGAATAKVVAALGHVHRLQGKLETAKADFKQAADRDFRSPRFASLYGEAAFDAGDFLTAQNAFQKGMELGPTHLRSAIGKARADVARNERVGEAMQIIDVVLSKGAEELTPSLKARALAGKAETLLAQADFAGAEAAAREAITAAAALGGDKSGAYGQFALGMALAKQKKDGASEAISAAIKAFPQAARFYFQGALALAEAGQSDKGAPLFEEYKNEQSLRTDDAYYVARGDFLRSAGKLDDALASYDEAIKETGKNIAEANYKKGLTLQTQATTGKGDKRKLYDEARKSYEAALGVREKYPEVYRQVGLMFLDLNPKSAEALENFGNALRYYKELRAPAATTDAFIAEVEAKYLKAGLKNNATAWRKEATDALR